MTAGRPLALLGALGMLACGAPRADGGDAPAARRDGGAAAAAPADTAGPVALRLDAARYAPGARVGITIVNRADARYTFNPCPRVVEHEVDGAWRAVEEDRVCTMEAWLLDPRGTREATTELPARLAAGRYRMVIAFSQEAVGADGRPVQPVRAVSAPFDVAP